MREQDIVIGQIYKHYKGNIYKVIALGKHSETEEDMVVYQSISSGEIWIRPKAMWNNIIDDKTKRFTLIEK